MDKNGTYEKMVEMMKNCCSKEGKMTDCFSMTRKMMDQQGIGSPCAEMKEKIMKHKENGDNFHCKEIMQAMMKDFSYFQKESEGSKK